MTTLSQLVITATKALKKNNKLDPELVASLVENLIKFEIKPGGPYLKNGRLDLLFNLNILRLFLLLGKSLPNVELYTNKNIAYPIPTHISSVLDDIASIKKSNLFINEDVFSNESYAFYFDFINTLAPEIREVAKNIGYKLAKSDRKGEITNLSSVFHDSLIEPTKFSPHELTLLGQANFFVWAAYSIYDDVIDGDSNPGYVSSANILARKSVELYRSLSIDFDLVLEYISRVDEANAWETNHCRFINTDNEVKIISVPREEEMELLLKNRAIAHILGPLLISKEDTLSIAQFKKIDNALEYYCIARQLNDDLHDWVDDYKNSRITIVVAALLNKTGITCGSFNSEKLLIKLKTTFYNSELERLCNLTESYIRKSETLLFEAGVIRKKNLFINSFIRPISYSASRAREKHLTNKKSVERLKVKLL